MFLFCALVMSAQDDGVKVKFLGDSPDIVDFAWSWATMMDDNPEDTPDESMTAVEKSLECYRTRRMTYVDMGIEVEYFNTSYGLPRVGKDITVTKWSESGKKTTKALKWNGSRFSY
jgi:hypothetical protein